MATQVLASDEGEAAETAKQGFTEGKETLRGLQSDVSKYGHWTKSRTIPENIGIEHERTVGLNMDLTAMVLVYRQLLCRS